MNQEQRNNMSKKMKQSWKARKALPVIRTQSHNISSQDKQHAVLLLQAVVKLLERD